ncbi:FBPase [Fragilaria crotonensis]|nr:FBPase [Fragilaria crotonensis]
MMSTVMLSLFLLICFLPSWTAGFISSQAKVNQIRYPLITSHGALSTEDKQYSVVQQTPTPPPTENSNGFDQRITLTRYLNNVVKEQPEFLPLQSLFLSMQMACKTISNLVNRAGLVYGIKDRSISGQQYQRDGRFYSMKRLDQLSTYVLRNALRFTGKVHMVTPAASLEEELAEHQPGVVIASALDSNYVAVVDPMDGSGNADASICTGTVFGIFEQQGAKEEKLFSSSDGDDATEQENLVRSVLQPGKNMRAAGYCLYSSATVLVITLGDTVMGFTLDPQLNEFVLTHPNLTIPQRGNVYSCNEANSEGWNDGFKDYLKSLKTGNNQSQQRYAHRYVGSMVGDIHRTLLYGGIFCYPADCGQHPRGNLQLLYKSAPMAFVVEKAGGKSMNQSGESLLEVQPERVHQKSPCFMGSPDDVDECRRYLQRDVDANRVE